MIAQSRGKSQCDCHTFTHRTQAYVYRDKAAVICVNHYQEPSGKQPQFRCMPHATGRPGKRMGLNLHKTAGTTGTFPNFR